MKSIAALAGELGKIAKLFRLLSGQGLGERALQFVIDDPVKRRRLVKYWNDGCPIFGELMLDIDRNRSIFDPIFQDHVLAYPQDRYSLSLKTVNFAKAFFVHMLRGDEQDISGDERLSRLQESPFILADAMIGIVLMENWQELGSKSVLESIRIFEDVTWMNFPGTIVCNRKKERFILYLRWDGEGWIKCLGLIDSRLPNNLSPLSLVFEPELVVHYS